MRIIRQTQRPLGGLALACALGMTACGGDYVILVHVAGLPADTALLSATAKNGDTYAKEAADIAPPYPLNVFSVKLPTTLSGRVSIEVSALGTDQCKSASGSAIVDLSQGRGQEVTVNLAALNPRRCSLIINQSGEGTVSATPAGTPCGTGCYDYNQSDTVVLKFSPTGTSYGAQTYVSSGGVCDGVNDCSLTLLRRSQVDASFQPRLCQSKWCWFHPLPQGNQLLGMWGTSASDIWAVGDGGTVLHYDGKIWSLLNSTTKQNLNGVWSGTAGSAWIVGDTGTILHWDGTKFSPETSRVTVHLNSIWGAAENNIYVVGDTGTILQRGGSSWTPQTSGVTNNLYRVSGSDPQNIWTVGQGLTVLANSGSGWSKKTAPVGLGSTMDVWTSGPNDVWTVGGATSADCGAARWNGVLWTKSAAICKIGVGAVWGNGTREVWAAGGEKPITRFVDNNLTAPITTDILGPTITRVPSYSAAWSPTAGEVYLSTYGGTIVRRVASPGGTQLLAPFPTISPTGAAATIKAVTGTSGGGSGPTIYIVYTDGTAYSYDGKKSVQLPQPPAGTFFDAWAAPSGELFVGVDMGYVFRFSGTSWTQLNLTSTSSNVTAVGGVSATDFYAGTALGYVYRLMGGTPPGGSLNATAFAGGINAIWTRSATESWAVGNGGAVVKLNLSSTSVISGATSTAGTTALYSVHGAAAPNKYMWLVGANGTIIRYDSSANSWMKMPSPVATTLTSVVALSDSDVWFSGDGGVLLHWDGTSTTPVTGPFGTRNLTEMYAPSATDIWMASGTNAVWRYMP